MKIGLIDIDSKYPNLALMKLSAWHKQKGDAVKWWNAFEPFDHVYASKVFTHTKNYYIPKGCTVGGSGVDLNLKLPDEVEHCYPDYELYKIDYAMGYLTRGCINKCPFCIVWRKEGVLHKHADLHEFWKDQSKLMLLDNALTDYPDAITELRQIHENKIKLNLTQGFNIRTISQEVANELAQCHTWEPYNQWHFSWDNIKDEDLIRKGLDIVHQAGIRPYKLMCYCLIGFNTTPDEDFYRINKLTEWGIDPFIMPFRKNHYLNALAKWVNKKQLFKSVTWTKYYQSLTTRTDIEQILLK